MKQIIATAVFFWLMYLVAQSVASAADYRYPRLATPTTRYYEAPVVTVHARPAPIPTAPVASMVPLILLPLAFAAAVVEAAVEIPIEVLGAPVPVAWPEVASTGYYDQYYQPPIVYGQSYGESYQYQSRSSYRAPGSYQQPPAPPVYYPQAPQPPALEDTSSWTEPQ